MNLPCVACGTPTDRVLTRGKRRAVVCDALPCNVKVTAVGAVLGPTPAVAAAFQRRVERSRAAAKRAKAARRRNRA